MTADGHGIETEACLQLYAAVTQMWHSSMTQTSTRASNCCINGLAMQCHLLPQLSESPKIKIHSRLHGLVIAAALDLLLR